MARLRRRERAPINLIEPRCPQGHTWKSMMANATNCPECQRLEVARRRNAALRELAGLFGENAVLRESDGRLEGDYMVTLYADEGKMRRIAEALRDIMPPPRPRYRSRRSE